MTYLVVVCVDVGTVDDEEVCANDKVADDGLMQRRVLLDDTRAVGVDVGAVCKETQYRGNVRVGDGSHESGVYGRARRRVKVFGELLLDVLGLYKLGLCLQVIVVTNLASPKALHRGNNRALENIVGSCVAEGLEQEQVGDTRFFAERLDLRRLLRQATMDTCTGRAQDHTKGSTVESLLGCFCD